MSGFKSAQRQYLPDCSAAKLADNRIHACIPGMYTNYLPAFPIYYLIAFITQMKL